MKQAINRLIWVVSILIAYSGFYAVLYCNRKPSANLAYWAYTKNCPEQVETGLYYIFYPAYFIHQRAFHAGRHTWDRPEWVMPPDFKG
ncbi:MAG TPA: hypothetical protein VKV04_08845 [Verrucomicrobiae bacterium]|nr:hypothetical protein [Verrucomicrobiae bacterium]